MFIQDYPIGKLADQGALLGLGSNKSTYSKNYSCMRVCSFFLKIVADEITDSDGGKLFHGMIAPGRKRE